MPYIKEDTYSNYNRNRLYAKAGTLVNIIRDTGGGVLLVKPEDGEAFSVFRNELTDEPGTGLPEEQKEGGVGAGKTSAVRRQKRTQPGNSPGLVPVPGQGSLF